MRKNIVQTLLCVALPLTFAVGCAHTPKQEAELYEPVDSATLTPTSARPVSRVYADDQGRPRGITRTAPAKGASAEDWALGEELRAALTTEKSLAYPSEVLVAVDKNSKGSVKLRGVVPNDRERQRLHDRIAAVPGVLQIDDQVTVGLPVHPGALDSRKPILQD